LSARVGCATFISSAGEIAMTTGPQSVISESSLFGAPWKQAVGGATLAAWFYFVGWAYSYFYFRFFHIDIFEIDMPLEFIVMQSTSPIVFALRNYWHYCFVLILISLAIIALIARSKFRFIVAARELILHNRRRVQLAVVIVILLVPYYGGLEIAKVAGTNQARNVWAAEAPEIQFSFAKDESDVAANSRLSKANDAHELRYLLATRDFYYVFTAEKARVKNYIPDGMVFKIRNDAVDSVWIRRRGGFINGP
jgi:hypothetical protein